MLASEFCAVFVDGAMLHSSAIPNPLLHRIEFKRVRMTVALENDCIEVAGRLACRRVEKERYTIIPLEKSA